MSHEWNAGVLIQSSWHGLETVEAMPDATAMIAAGERTKAWPRSVGLESMVTGTGLAVPGKAVVATYADQSRVAMSAVGARYKPLDPKEWRATVEAAVKAGAKPAGAFSLRGGSRLLATFEIDGGNAGSGLRNYFNLVDALDGSLCHIAGGSSIRVVCANTLSMAMGELKGAGGSVRHTASVNENAALLRDAIEAHVKRGETVRETYKASRELRLSKPDADVIFASLFPESNDEIRKASPAKATRMDNARSDAARAMKRQENYEGPTLATIWNAATWLVDRDVNGKAKPARGGADKLDSMLFGTRGDRIAEIQNVIEVVLRDGSIQSMTIDEARTVGVPAAQTGKSPLETMLEG